MRSTIAGILSVCFAALASPALTGCAVDPKPKAKTAASFIEAARAQGITLSDPLALDQDIVDEAAKHLGTGRAPEKMKHVADFLGRSQWVLRMQGQVPGNGLLRFDYARGRSLTAIEAYRERRADCMAFTTLFVAIMRAVGVPAYFVHVREVRHYYEKDGWFFTSSHVAAGYSQGPAAVVMDFTREVTDWRLTLYNAIEDGAALALFYNNIAVEAMTKGRYHEAEKLFRVLLDQEPNVAELYTNYGALLNRRGKHKEALAVLEQGLLRFADYKPLYTNAILAARGAGDEARAVALEKAGQALENNDPHFIFARGVRLFEKGGYVAAAGEFERAASARPDSAAVFAWLARAHLKAGKKDEGQRAFAAVKRLAPDSRFVNELEQQFPDMLAPQKASP